MRKGSKFRGLIIMMLLCFWVMPLTGHAKTTVSKVTSKRYNYRTNDNYYQYSVICGKTKKGKTVWKYTTSKCIATELDSASWKVKGNYVYVIDNTTFLRLNKQNGKVVSKKKFKSSFSLWGATMYVDGSGNLYAIGYYGQHLIKFTSKGTVKWTRKIKNSYYWPYKITSSGRKLTVYFDGNGRKAAIDTKTGKISSYY